MHSSQIVIFMATYNGQRYLAEQIDSIQLQTHKQWKILVSDDGSVDNTRQILSDYQAKLGAHRFVIYPGPCKGFSANFLSLICKDNIDGDYYAYSDQDDVWDPNKLERALRWLDTIPETVPALYCSRTRLISETGVALKCSLLFKKKPSFHNALVQNIGGGNTMIFNHAAFKLLRSAGDNIKVVSHDWWTYILVTGAGGEVHYDPTPTLNYRQHTFNTIGANLGWYARFQRILALFQGRFKDWIETNATALYSNQQLLKDENKKVLDQLMSARQDTLVARVVKIKRLGFYRQTFLGNIGLLAATIFKKI